MTKRRCEMTPEQLARDDARKAERAATRPSRATNNTSALPYTLTEDEREQLAYLGHIALWPKDALAAAYGVTRRTLYDVMKRYPRRTA